MKDFESRKEGINDAEPPLSLQDLGIADLLNEGDDVQHHGSNHRRLMWGAGIAGATVLGTLALTAPFVLSRSPLPYMATPGHKIKRALEFIQQKQTTVQRTSSGGSGSSNSSSCTKPSLQGTFVDLGSGDGEGVYQAALTGHYHQAIGIELNWTLCTLSRLRRQFFWNVTLRRRCRFYRQDFFSYSLHQANTCLIFGVTPLMVPISRKLAQECAPGTHVLAYRFQLPLACDKDSTLLKAKVIYDVEEMRVYECQ